MSNTYAPQTPRDKTGSAKEGYPPAKVALVSWNKENASASSILLLGHNTTEIEIAAIGQSMAGKWISQANVDASVAATSVITVAGTANFDFVVPISTQRRFVVPISTFNQNAVGSVQGVNRAEGLFPALAVKTLAGNGSVLAAEF